MKKEEKGSITVFLALLLSLLVSLVGAGIQSVQNGAARVQILSALDVGLYSLFGQYERGLFKDYDLFALDAAGKEGLDLEGLCENMEEYIKPVLSQNGGRLSLKESEIEGYTLMTDEKGEPFYQQVTSYMKETLGIQGVQLLLEKMEERREKTAQAEAEGNRAEAGGALETYESEMSQAAKKSQEAQEAREENQEEFTDGEAPQAENPIPAIRRIRWMGLLELVLPLGKQVSEKKAPSGFLPSDRSLYAGKPLSKSHKTDTSLVSQVLYQQYLLDRLGNYEKPGEGCLAYQIEYILGGKKSDEDNLRAMARKLLIIREGVNAAALTADSAKRAQAAALASAIASGFLIPPAAGIIEGALILCWAFGESILDVRELFDGGRIPLVKTAQDWQLSLENLPNLLSRLDTDRKSSQEGMTYGDYLQVLLLAQSRQKKVSRGMDMVEAEVRSQKGWEDFRLDSCITALEASIQVKALGKKLLTAKREYCY